MNRPFQNVEEDDDLSPPSVVRKPEGVENALRSNAALKLGVSLDLGEELGRGGMGTVHIALDRWLGRRVAVKLLSPSSDRELVDRRFILEAQLAAQLEHPNIVPFYELLVADDGAPALVMRLVRGQTMAAYLATCGSSVEMSHTAPYDLPSRLERFLKVCDAVAYAHARCVVHRDLKPDNVMLGTHNEVYVMDWGVARVMADEKEDRVSSGSYSREGSTRTGEIMGTPGYMSPEQAASESITYAADQYALGMMLAEIATLSAPRPGAELEQLSAAMLANEARLVHRFDEEVPVPLAAIVRKATFRHAGQRYPSVEAFAADVRRFMRDEAISIIREPKWHRAWRWTKRRPVLVLGTFTMLVSLVAVLAVLVLFGRLEARTRAERRSERLSEITAAIGRRARRVDTQFQRVALLVEGLADAADQVMQREPQGDSHGYTPADLALLDSTKVVERYGQRVSFVHAATVVSPGVREPSMAPLQKRASDLQDLLEDAAARASGRGSALLWNRDERQRIALAGSPLHWTDLAFEEGVLFVYPGNTFFPADYDVRHRPWYVEAKRQSRLLWGSPYPDATSGRLLLPCSRAFFSRTGEARGVAAAHMALEGVLDSLDFHEIAGFQSAALLDERADVVLSTLSRGADFGQGTHQNRAVDREPFPVSQVREAIVGKKRDGRVFDESGLYVYQRLEGNEWSLVATLDSAIVD